ncbi:hypothetical protein [Actinoplanes sp. NPDC049681]|uniref:hypothetical protein n=1 Tax=Actinoplanes sp. NPDC049681 TaxID=3363905 RepID=UPI00378CEA83
MNRAGPAPVRNGEDPDEPLSKSHNGHRPVPVHGARDFIAAPGGEDVETMSLIYRLARDAGRGHEAVMAWWRRRGARELASLRRENARLRRQLADIRGTRRYRY